METMFKQNFGGTNKEYYGIFESGLFLFVERTRTSAKCAKTKTPFRAEVIYCLVNSKEKFREYSGYPDFEKTSCRPC